MFDIECTLNITDELINSFITTNNLKLNRTEEELEAKLKEENKGFMSFGLDPLFGVIPLKLAKPYINKETYTKYESGEDTWETLIFEQVVREFLEYMVFAWGKAFDEKGLSASRSIIKLSAWLWLLGRDDLMQIIDDDDRYKPYGAPALIDVCVELNIKVPDYLIEFSKNKVSE
jgi:hypothetical protein